MKPRWKYIVWRNQTGQENLERFDPSQIHASFAARRNIPRSAIMSAGFIDDDGECYGASSSLGLPSRPRADSALARGGD